MMLLLKVDKTSQTSKWISVKISKSAFISTRCVFIATISLLVVCDDIWNLGTFVEGNITFECNHIRPRNKLECECIHDGRIINQPQQNLVSWLTSYQYENLYFRDVVIYGCIRLDLKVDFGDFRVGNALQNVTDLTFESVERLDLEIGDIDFGEKNLIFSNIHDLTISGKLDKEGTQIKMFIRNDRITRGDVTFRNFVSNYDLEVFKVSDVRYLRVLDSYINSISSFELSRVTRCFYEEVSSTKEEDSVDCSQISLFPTTYDRFIYVISHPAFIVFFALLVVMIVLAIFAYLYHRRWRARHMLEKIGYPPPVVVQHQHQASGGSSSQGSMSVAELKHHQQRASTGRHVTVTNLDSNNNINPPSSAEQLAYTNKGYDERDRSIGTTMYTSDNPRGHVGVIPQGVPASATSSLSSTDFYYGQTTSGGAEDPNINKVNNKVMVGGDPHPQSSSSNQRHV